MMKIAIGLYSFCGQMRRISRHSGNVDSKNCVQSADNNQHDVFANQLHDGKATLFFSEIKKKS